MTTTIRLYCSRGNWRWTMRARNGRIIGASSEGYVKRGDALRNLRRVTRIDCGLDTYSPNDSSYASFEWRIER